jgi:hypothetical protein
MTLRQLGDDSDFGVMPAPPDATHALGGATPQHPGWVENWIVGAAHPYGLNDDRLAGIVIDQQTVMATAGEPLNNTAAPTPVGTEHLS